MQLLKHGRKRAFSSSSAVTSRAKGSLMNMCPWIENTNTVNRDGKQRVLSSPSAVAGATKESVFLTMSNHFPRHQLQQSIRQFATTTTITKPTKKAVLMDSEELRNKLDNFQDLFVEARLCIEDARDSAETTYFDEEVDTAQVAVDEAMAAFNELVNELEDLDQKNSVLRSNGLKAEQLKGELQLVLSGGH